MPQSNAQRAQKLADRIAAQVQRSAGKGLKSAIIFLKNRLQEGISEPAPRKVFNDPRTGNKVYMATVPAKVGAPPRKLSGQLRRSITHQMIDENTGVVGTNMVYARQLEFGGIITPKTAKVLRFYAPQGKKAMPVFANKVIQKPHPFLGPTAAKWQKQLAAIVGAEVKAGFK